MLIHTDKISLKDYTVFIKEVRCKKEHPAWLHLYGVPEQVELNYSDRNLRGRSGDWLGEGKRELSGANENFYILIKV